MRPFIHTPRMNLEPPAYTADRRAALCAAAAGFVLTLVALVSRSSMGAPAHVARQMAASASVDRATQTSPRSGNELRSSSPLPTGWAQGWLTGESA